MSVKSERKKAVKAQRQAAGKATDIMLPMLPIQWYAEESARAIDEHNANCTDRACTDDIKLFYKAFPMVAMIKSHEPKTLYIAPYGTDTPRDYQPIYALHLETGEEIAGSFEADGSTRCSVTGHNATDQPICLTLLCHRAGVALVVHKDAPDTVSVICADPECGNAICSGENLLTRKMKLAKQPAVEYPNKFCRYHGVQPIYIACVHVAHGEKEPMHFEPPDNYAGGTRLLFRRVQRRV